MAISHEQAKEYVDALAKYVSALSQADREWANAVQAKLHEYVAQQRENQDVNEKVAALTSKCGTCDGELFLACDNCGEVL